MTNKPNLTEARVETYGSPELCVDTAATANASPGK
jgi:hypothetical protein